MNPSVNKTMLITGSTDGIGKQTALDLLHMGHAVIIHGRTENKARTTAKELERKSGNPNIDFVSGDLSSLGSIREMSTALHERYNQLDVLINNAGVFQNSRVMSPDGFELTFAVNHLGHFLLTGLLMDLLNKADHARIINVASMAHADSLDFDNLQAEKHFDGYDAYSRSKLCNILFTYRLAHKLQTSNITVNALHPGVISTKLLHAGWGAGGSDIRQGSKTSAYLASSSDVKHTSGKYFSNQRSTRSSQISYNTDVQQHLWDLSETFCGIHY